jgi:hypothetical protein
MASARPGRAGHPDRRIDEAARAAGHRVAWCLDELGYRIRDPG